MCGIFGIVTRSEQPLGPLLLEAGRKLTYQGYDSVGCATIRQDGTIDLRKDVGEIDEVSSRLDFADMSGTRGLIQLRWATFGSPSRVNAQPHIDSDGDLVGAHNGNVVNHAELRQQFLLEGMLVRSTNDGETCVHAVERYIERGDCLAEATRQAYNDLAGDFSFIISRVGDDHLCAVKKGAGLAIGIADGFTCVSSDLPSILTFTRKVIHVGEGEIVTLWSDRVEIRRIADGAMVERPAELVTESMETAQKSGYRHYMVKEIYEQPRVTAELIRLLEDSPHSLPMVERMASARNLFLVGCGSSYNACLLASFYMGCLANRTAIPVLPPQFIAQYAPALKPEDVVVFVSQSGETRDVLNAEAIARRQGATTLGFVNVIGSSLTRLTTRYLPLVCGYEVSPAATKTFTNQVVALLYITLQMGNLPAGSLASLPGLQQQALEETAGQIEPVGSLLSSWEDFYCLGYGSTYAIAKEGALKFKQVTYIHSEGMLSTEFKHGSLTAVNEGYPVIFIAGPEDVPLMISGVKEVAHRGGNTIVFAEENVRLRSNAQHMVVLPKAGPLLNPLVAILPLQLLAYQLSLARGIDPDYPRNLSKTLTTD